MDIMRLNVIIPISSAAQGNAVAQSITGNPADAETFGVVRLSADGLEPATHLGCSTYMADNLKPQLRTLQSQVTALHYTSTNSWDVFIKGFGLQVINPPMETRP